MIEAELLATVATITTSIFEAEDRPAIFQALNSGCSALGFDVFALSCHAPLGPELMLDTTLSTVPASFLGDYERFNWFEADVNAARSIAGEGPFFWDAITEPCDHDGHQR